MIEAMKLIVLFLVLVLGIMFYFKAPGFFPALAKNSTTSAVISQTPTGFIGQVLGVAIETARTTVTNFVPPAVIEKMLTDTTTSVVSNVQSDINGAVSQTVNSILASQLINNFKNLPKPVQEQVKQNICK